MDYTDDRATRRSRRLELVILNGSPAPSSDICLIADRFVISQARTKQCDTGKLARVVHLLVFLLHVAFLSFTL